MRLRGHLRAQPTPLHLAEKKADKMQAIARRLDAMFVACANAIGKEAFEAAGKNLPEAIARLRARAEAVDGKE